LQGDRSSQEAAGVERHHVRIGLRYSLQVARVDIRKWHFSDVPILATKVGYQG
jgi:hypothetical protein